MHESIYALVSYLQYFGIKLDTVTNEKRAKYLVDTIGKDIPSILTNVSLKVLIGNDLSGLQKLFVTLL